MSSYDRWRPADERWVQDNLPLLQGVFLWFAEHREWPEVSTLRHRLYQAGDRTTDVQAIANAKPNIPGLLDMPQRSSIVLGARHLLTIKEARTLLLATTVAAQRAVHQFLYGVDPGQPALVSRDDVYAELPKQFLGGRLPDDMQVSFDLLPAFVTSDNPTPFGGGALSGDWSLNVRPDLVMDFEGVETPAKYVESQLKIIRSWCDDYDARTGSTPASDQFRRAFIVMPFEEPWSDDVHAFINRAIGEFSGRLVAIRADQIDAPGKITEQIVNELATCDLVIADITGNNPNVAWELGFAYAHDKPCVILRQAGLSQRAPFDIYDHRRIEYSANPTPIEEERIVRAIGAALDQAAEPDQGPDDGWLFHNA